MRSGRGWATPHQPPVEPADSSAWLPLVSPQCWNMIMFCRFLFGFKMSELKWETCCTMNISTAWNHGKSWEPWDAGGRQKRWDSVEDVCLFQREFCLYCLTFKWNILPIDLDYPTAKITIYNLPEVKICLLLDLFWQTEACINLLAVNEPQWGVQQLCMNSLNATVFWSQLVLLSEMAPILSRQFTDLKHADFVMDTDTPQIDNLFR